MASTLFVNPGWNPANVVLSAHKGLYQNAQWENYINYNKVSPRDPLLFHPPEYVKAGFKKYNIDTGMSEAEAEKTVKDVISLMKNNLYPFITLANIYNLFKTARIVLTEAYQIDYLKVNFDDYQTPILMGTGLLAVLNVTALFKQVTNKNITDEGSLTDKFLVVVWQATPYLLIITNFVLIYIEASYNPVGAGIKLVMTGITLLDVSPWTPKSFKWYLHYGIGTPLDLAAMYYDPKDLLMRGANFIISGKLHMILGLFQRSTAPQAAAAGAA